MKSKELIKIFDYNDSDGLEQIFEDNPNKIAAIVLEPTQFEEPNNTFLQKDKKYFFEKNELKTILDLYAKMVSEGSWKDYGLNISSRQVGFSVFKNAAENAMYKICKNFKPSNKNLKYLITDSKGKILNNSHDLVILIKNTNWKKL